MPRHRLLPLAAIAAATLALSACAPALPPSVVADSSVTVGWGGRLTSFNAATDPTAANRDIAAATRAYVERLGPLPDAADEAGVYAALGVPWCPPELREEPFRGTPPPLVEGDVVRMVVEGVGELIGRVGSAVAATAVPRARPRPRDRRRTL